MFNKTFIFEVDYLNTHYSHELLSLTDTQLRPSDCPACGGKMLPFTKTSLAQGEPVLEKSICAECAYIHFTRVPGEQWFQNFYQNRWDASRAFPKTYHPNSRQYRRNLELFRDYAIGPTAKIFDFGAGYGQFLTKCQTQGYRNLFGVEASERRARHCQKKLGLNVVICNGETLAEHPEVAAAAPFDVVHSHHVFEHVTDISACLDNVYQILKPNGLFMLHIPHFTDDHFIEIAHSLVHVRQFTLRSVSLLLAKHGFQLDQIDDGISVVAIKDGSGKTKKIDRPAPREFVTKLNRNFAVDWESAANGRHIWFDLKPFDASMPTAMPDDQLGLQDQLTWSIKRLVMGTRKPDLPAFGPAGSLINLIHMRNLGTKICRRVFTFGNWELGARITCQPCEQGTAPLVDFRYGTQKAVALIK